MAATPISGDLEAATLKPELREIIRVETPTTKRPEIIPENAPVFVIFFEKNSGSRPQRTADGTGFKAVGQPGADIILLNKRKNLPGIGHLANCPGLVKP